MKKFIFLTVLIITISGCDDKKQDELRLQYLLDDIDKAFVQKDSARMKKLILVEEVSDFYRQVCEDNEIGVNSGGSQILQSYRDSAHVLLIGTLLFGNSGDETFYSGFYSGIYRAIRNDTIWNIDKRIGIGSHNKVLQHHLNVEVSPGNSLVIYDTISSVIENDYGFLSRLNHHSIIHQVTVDREPVEYILDGGFLWVDTGGKGEKEIGLHYSIDVEKDEEDRNSCYWGTEFGHVRNQYFWHPFFDFASPDDRASFKIRCIIPKEYYLTTSLPQSDTISGEMRIIEARSEFPTFGLSLYYDSSWSVSEYQKDDIELILYTDSDFEPQADDLYKEFLAAYEVLEENYGKPSSSYFGVVQDVSSGGNGWKNRSNNVLVAARNGSFTEIKSVNPRAIFGHEVSHAWTNPSGPATNFLSEGWATYAESKLLAAKYGEEIIPEFFRAQKERFFSNGHNSNHAIWDDYSNNGVSYNKGSWIYYMLEKQLGETIFNQGLYNFFQGENHTIESFFNELDKVSVEKISDRFYVWLKSKEVPSLSVRKDTNNTIVIEQIQNEDLFVFPLKVKVILEGGGEVIKEILVSERKQILSDIDGLIVDFEIDPFSELLFKEEN